MVNKLLIDLADLPLINLIGQSHGTINFACLCVQDSYLANRLLTFLMEHCSHDSRSVLQNNLEIIKTLVESWKSVLKPSSK